MSRKYKMANEDGIYFLTMTVVEWVDIFTRLIYKEEIIKSLQYCVEQKGLNVHAYVIMSNHIHLIISRQADGQQLSDIVRDLKKFTAKKIIQLIGDKKTGESRKEWLLERFESNGKKKGTKHQFWQHHNQPILLYSPKFIRQKIDYIHQNPVRAGIVYKEVV